MKYQDRKVTGVMRLLALNSALTAVLIFLLWKPEFADALVRFIRPSGNVGGAPAVISFALVALVCWGVLAWQLAWSPAQDAAYLRQRAGNGKSVGGVDFDLIDPTDPDFHTSTARYILNKFRRSSTRSQ